MKVMASYIPAKHEEDTEMLYKHPSLSGTVSTWLRSLECRLKCAGAHWFRLQLVLYLYNNLQMWLFITYTIANNTFKRLSLKNK